MQAPAPSQRRPAAARGSGRHHAARTPQSEIVVYSCFFETCLRAFMYGVCAHVCVLYAKIHAQQRFCADHRSRPATRTTEKRGNRNVLRCFGERCLSYIHASFFKDFDHNGPQSPKNFLASRGGRSQVVKKISPVAPKHTFHTSSCFWCTFWERDCWLLAGSGDGRSASICVWPSAAPKLS